MNEKRNKTISKFLSLVLRHQPDAIGIRLDAAGWAEVSELQAKMVSHDRAPDITLEQLRHVVASNDKQRFEFDAREQRIRARQGHSIDVDHGLEPVEPPEILLHGTPVIVLDLIRETGLKKMQRHHVHLHEDQSVANDVGARRGQPVILRILAAQMHAHGHEFFVTANNVWLTDHVPPEFIEFPPGK